MRSVAEIQTQLALSLTQSRRVVIQSGRPVSSCARRYQVSHSASPSGHVQDLCFALLLLRLCLRTLSTLTMTSDTRVICTLFCQQEKPEEKGKEWMLADTQPGVNRNENE